MKSHGYDFSLADLVETLSPPLIPLGLFALVMHLGAVSGLLPRPCPALDTDRTILLHQAQASRERHDASLLFLGDSSCLMDVSAAHLDPSLSGAAPALNLGTLSYLDLYGFSSLVEHYVRANPDRLRTVVLLLNPEALRRASPTDYHAEVLSHFYNESDYCGPTLPPLLCGLGVEIFRGRLFSRAMPQPLSGAYGDFYGFTHDLWKYLSAHHGSAIDPGHFDAASAHASVEYRLAKSFEKASQDFRAALPDGVKLYVGITPLPETLVGPSFRQRYREMLETWSQWLKADAPLAELPATLPDDLFASAAHLNERGARLYTEQLARDLWPHVPAPR